jgi:class 3 adenylate cyclase
VRGRVVKDTGGGVMAEFGSAVAAMDAAWPPSALWARLNRVGPLKWGGSVAIRWGVDR